MDTTLSSSSSDFKESKSEEPQQESWLKTVATLIIWIELIPGLSAISSAVFLNPRVPVLLYAFYGAYFAIFLVLLYSTCRSTYLQNGPIRYVYLICGGCTVATIGIVLFTFLTAPNSGEIAFISTIVFLVSLVLLPFISAMFYFFLRGNFIMPQYMRGKKRTQQRGEDQVDSNVQIDARNLPQV